MDRLHVKHNYNLSSKMKQFVCLGCVDVYLLAVKYPSTVS